MQISCVLWYTGIHCSKTCAHMAVEYTLNCSCVVLCVGYTYVHTYMHTSVPAYVYIYIQTTHIYLDTCIYIYIHMPSHCSSIISMACRHTKISSSCHALRITLTLRMTITNTMHAWLRHTHHLMLSELPNLWCAALTKCASERMIWSYYVHMYISHIYHIRAAYDIYILIIQCPYVYKPYLSH